MVGPISAHNLCKHWVVYVLWLREAEEITIAGMDLANCIKTHYIDLLWNCSIDFTKKGASWATNQIRIAAPHFHVCVGHWWANFDTQYVQTLSCWCFVASRNIANHDSWHGFIEFYERSSDFLKCSINTRKRCLRSKKTAQHSSASFWNRFWAWVGKFQHKVCANIYLLMVCGLAKQCKSR